MDDIKKKKYKKSSKPKFQVENGQAEVFVIPPDLLAKLGINLGAINQTGNEKDIVFKEVVETKTNQEKQARGNTSKSSILETANLMKASVFCSPTFSNNHSTNGVNEDYIQNDITTTEEYYVPNGNIDGIHSERNHQIIVNKMLQEKPGIETKSLTNNNHIADKKNPSKVSVSNESLMIVNSSTDKDPVQMSGGKSNGTNNVDDHPDEAYSSNCWNSNLDSIVKISGDYTVQTNSNNSIQIFSEQIQNPLQIIETKSSSTVNTSLTMISPTISTKNCDIVTNDANTSSKYITNMSVMDEIRDSTKIAINNLGFDSTQGNESKVITKAAEKDELGKDSLHNQSDDKINISELEAINTNIINQIIEDININNVKEPIEKTKKCDNNSAKTNEININGLDDTDEIKATVYIAHDDTVQNENGKSSLDNTVKELAKVTIECGNNNATTIEIDTNDFEDKIRRNKYNECTKHKKVKQIFESTKYRDDKAAKAKEKDVIDLKTIQKKVREGITHKNVKDSTENTTKCPSIVNTKEKNSNDCRTIDNSIQNKISESTNNRIVKEAVDTDTKNCDKNGATSKEDITEEKAQEIAKYLNQINEKRKMLQLSKRTKKNNTMQSKLRIQGVEKPGGDNETMAITKPSNKPVKTYKPSTRSKFIPVLSKIKNLDDMYLLPSNNMETNAKILDCICHDFGQLKCYEADDLYQHIHYWNHDKIDCDSDTVISIYNEYNVIDRLLDPKIDCLDEQPANDGTIIINNVICWSDTGIDVHTDFETFNPNRDDNSKITPLGKNEKKGVESDATISNNLSNKNSSNNTKKANGNTSLKHKISSDINKSKEPENGKVTTSEHILKTQMNPESKSQKVEEQSNVKTSKMAATSKVNQKSIDDSSTRANRKRSLAVDESNEGKRQSISKSDNATSPKGRPVSKHRKSIMIEYTQTSNDKETPNSHRSSIDKKSTPEQPNTHIPQNNSKNENVIFQAPIDIETENDSNDKVVQNEDSMVVCGLCKNSVIESSWIQHISKEHNYLAWRNTEQALNFNDEQDVIDHLHVIKTEIGEFVCSRCSAVRKMAKSFYNHIKKCDGPSVENNLLEKRRNRKSVGIPDDASTSSPSPSNIPTKVSKTGASRKSIEGTPNKVKKKSVKSVICAVCSQSVSERDWIEHIKTEHDYLAWHTKENPVDLKDETSVKVHLKTISDKTGGLVCKKCGLARRYVKHYFAHIETCDGTRPDLNNTADTDKQMLDKTSEEDKPPVVECGVCKERIARKAWLKHMTKEHNYMAWIEGEEQPVDFTNDDEVYQHLARTVKLTHELICPRCGLERKYAKPYMLHLKECNANEQVDMLANKYVKIEATVGDGEFMCGVCQEKGALSAWRDHAMDKHYNVAWKVGDPPINLRNIYHVLKYLKEYNLKHKLVCKVCGISRVSHYGFYAHILQCGKDESELERLFDMCNICNNKYLCIYKSQHMTVHREKEIKEEMKLAAAAIAEKKKKEALETSVPTGKRRAAEKAKKEIEIFVGNDENKEVHSGDCSDTDVTVKLEHESGHESSDDDAISDASADDIIAIENTPYKKRAYTDGAIRIRLPFKVSSYSAYLKQSFDDFCELYLSKETLFDDLRNNEHEIVPDDEVSKYLPPLTESCKIRLLNQEWSTLKRFEAVKFNGGSALFCGGAIRDIFWAPARGEEHYLLVNSHAAADEPRQHPTDLTPHHGLLQIWKFDKYIGSPTLKLCLTHWFGTVWACSWCPSGARDAPHAAATAAAADAATADTDADTPDAAADAAPDAAADAAAATADAAAAAAAAADAAAAAAAAAAADDAAAAAATAARRLGLLALACSDGRAYVVAVPYPSEELDVQYLKIKPIVELRLSMTPDRRLYQACSICWSNQKGHEEIIVGYSDGTTAFYDLNTESPFLKTKENGVTILYPFQDRRPENTPITGVWAHASVSAGASASWCAAGGAPALALPAHRLAPSIHWPAVLVASDVQLSLNCPNELEWFGGGRRLGGASAGAACARCGALAAASAPALRLMCTHPCYPELKKKNIAMLKMVPLGKKRTHKQSNTDLSMVIQPLTYEDAVAKYGLHLTLLKSTDPASSKVCTENDQLPERYPLSDITFMDFCPSDRYHNKLAFATHSGFVFVINT